MLQDNNPDAAGMYALHINRQDGEKEEQPVLYLTDIETKGKSFAHHTSAVSSCIIL